MDFEYYRSRYTADDSTYIEAWINGEPWCDVTVNLSGYGIFPENEDTVFVPAYKIDKGTLDRIMDNLASKIEGEVIIGPYDSVCYKVVLKENWKEQCQIL